MRPYSEKLNEILGNIMSNMEAGSAMSFNRTGEVKNVLLVVLDLRQRVVWWVQLKRYQSGSLAVERNLRRPIRQRKRNHDLHW
jgi:hypothetical protein